MQKKLTCKGRRKKKNQVTYFTEEPRKTHNK